MADLRSIADAVKNGRAKVVKQLVPEALAEGIPVSEILNNGLLVGMTELGELFKKNEVYVPEVLVAARAMKVGTDLLKPYMMSADIQSRGVVADVYKRQTPTPCPLEGPSGRGPVYRKNGADGRIQDDALWRHLGRILPPSGRAHRRTMV